MNYGSNDAPMSFHAVLLQADELIILGSYEDIKDVDQALKAFKVS